MQPTKQEEKGHSEVSWIKAKIRSFCDWHKQEIWQLTIDDTQIKFQTKSNNSIVQSSKASLCEMIWNRLIYSSVTDSNKVTAEY